MIKKNTVREILETVKVDDVVGDFVNLKRRGTNLIGLCPFHNEKTPSFNVNPARNIYKCFGCGRGGDAVNFLMEHEHLSFPESLRWVAAKYGIEIEEVELTAEELAEQQIADSLYIANQFAQEYFEQQLFDSDRGRSVGLSYFKNRGFREETIKKFGLGYAPFGRNEFLKKAIQIGHKQEVLEKAGLVKGDRDFFRDRVMFAIRNLSGKVIGFGGRILQKNVKAPKYINTPETDVYNKSKVLFGAYHAKQAIRRHDECIITEGYTDVISLHQSGIENVVASSGTSLTVDQIRLIKRYTPNAKMLFDGDAAGTKAALRGINLLLEQDLNVKVVLLPDGEDPDSYLQKVGLTVFQDYLEHKAEDFIFFKANLLLKDAGNDPVKRTAVIKDIVGSIALIPDPLKRSLYIKECARLFGVEERLLLVEINKIIAHRIQKHQQKQKAQPQYDPSFPTEEPQFHQQENEEGHLPPATKTAIGDEYQERDLVRLLILFGHEKTEDDEHKIYAEKILADIDDLIDNFEDPLYQRIVKECQIKVAKGEEYSALYFKEHETEEIRTLAINLFISPYEYSENWEKHDIILNQKLPDQNYDNDIAQGVKYFRRRKLGGLCQEVKKEIKKLEGKDDEQELILHLKLLQRLQKLRNDIAKDLGTVVL